MKTIDVIPIGKTVKIGENQDIKGWITSINISANNKVEYKVSYFKDLELKSEWFQEFMVVVNLNSKKLRVGFVNGTD